MERQMRRIVIALDAQQLSALNNLAKRERRGLREQVEILIDEGLSRLGLLSREAMTANAAPIARGEIIPNAQEGDLQHAKN
jgi:hypothetical protein